MKRVFFIGDFAFIWLKGGEFALVGGAMFGVVPKTLWAGKYPADDDNTISMLAWPLLIKTLESLVIIETGPGNKLTDKQKQIFRVKEEWNLIAELRAPGRERGHQSCDHYPLRF